MSNPAHRWTDQCACVSVCEPISCENLVNLSLIKSYSLCAVSIYINTRSDSAHSKFPCLAACFVRACACVRMRVCVCVLMSCKSMCVKYVCAFANACNDLNQTSVIQNLNSQVLCASLTMCVCVCVCV